MIYDNSITDCNNAYEMGKMKTYWLSTNVTNIPNGNNAWYVISITNKSSISTNAYVTQIAIIGDAQNKNQIFIRHRYIASYSPLTVAWTSWKEL